MDLGIFALVFLEILGLQTAWTVVERTTPPVDQRDPVKAREPRRPELASIFTRFSIVPVRVHFAGPRVPVELKHARRGKNLC
jgi:hypothetical protein